MGYLNYITSIAALANLGLGLIVLIRNPKKMLNILFGLFALFSSGWCLINFIFWLSPSLPLFKLQYFFGPIVIVGGIFWIEAFLGKLKTAKTILLLLIASVMAILPLIDGLIVYNLDLSSKDALIFQHGPLFDVYSVAINILFLFIPIILIRARFKAKGQFKKQINYILLGALGTGGISMFFIFILPFFGISLITSVDAQSTLILVGFSTYAIVKHRFLDIRMIVARSVAFTIMLAFIGIFYTFTMIWLEKIIFPHSEGSLSPGQIIFRIVLTLFVVFTFQPLKRWITKKTDKIFFKQTYDPDELLEELSRTMGSSIVLIELLYRVLSILTEEMKVSRGFFVILKDGKTIDTTQGVGYKSSPKLTLNEIDILCKEGVSIYDELEENSKKKQILRKHDASISIPLRTNNKFSGVLLLGEKSSGDMYSAQDLSIFEILGPEVTVAIENAKSYEEIQQFNAVLRTEIKKATRELETANTNLRELDKAKDEFITMASHQLRTPLTAIKGYLSMLMEGDAGEIKMGQYEFIQEAYYGATRMVSLINDLLNVSRMETGRFFLEVSEFDIVRTVEEEIKQLEKGVKDKGLKLDFKHSAKQMKLCADEMKVRQVVMNFIDNAIYYTLDGTINVKLYEQGKNVCFEVADRGIGVPREQQKHLFTKFYRAENARQTRPDGTGLGLFMARKVIEEHNGEIIFHSVEGKGSTFGFRLPKKAAVNKDSLSDFDSDIPLSTPVDKAIGIMDEKIKKDVGKEEKEVVKVAES